MPVATHTMIYTQNHIRSVTLTHGQNKPTIDHNLLLVTKDTTKDKWRTGCLTGLSHNKNYAINSSQSINLNINI